jgi:hypothetical protein
MCARARACVCVCVCVIVNISIHGGITCSCHLRFGTCTIVSALCLSNLNIRCTALQLLSLTDTNAEFIYMIYPQSRASKPTFRHFALFLF